ncbi:UNVERIFIED_ORG: hypothetical protein J2W16_001493 [Pseudomonas cremoricolorata]|nr:hypothetical protein [Pseudomonas cremoricolorata]
MDTSNSDPITTAGVETFLQAGTPPVNLLAYSPASRWMLRTSTSPS